MCTRMNQQITQESTYESENTVYFLITNLHSLDNFSAHAITIWDMNFPTVEHAYQWKKFSKIRPDIAQQIKDTKSPQVAKKISSQYKNETPDNWETQKVSIMEELLHAKYAQHEYECDSEWQKEHYYFTIRTIGLSTGCSC